MKKGSRSSGYSRQARLKIAVTMVFTIVIVIAGGYIIHQYALPNPSKEPTPDELGEPVFSTSIMSDTPAANSNMYDFTGTTVQESAVSNSVPVTESEMETEPEIVPEISVDTAPLQDEVQPEVPPSTPLSVNPAVPLNEYGIYSKAALLLDLETGETIFSLRENEQIPPASLAKMMTAIVAIEVCNNLDATITITEDMLDGLLAAGASTAGFIAGETLTILDLLYGCMLPSGADATNALAFAAAGSVESFVTMMNQKAAAIGMSNTNFTNTHGLTDDNLYSTCADLAKLLTHCLQDETFRTLFTTATYTTTATPQHPKGIFLQNKVALAIMEQDVTNGHILGNKVGFTTPAGQCLASLAQINDREYILITVGAGKKGYNTHRFNLLDALYLYSTISD